MKTLGERIKWARVAAGLGQKELGQLLGYGDKANSRISNWETNTSSPNVEELAKLCYVLQVSPNVLIPVELVDVQIDAQNIIRNQKVASLNVVGRKKVDEYLDDIIETRKYGAEINPVTGEPFDEDAEIRNHPAFRHLLKNTSDSENKANA